MGSILPEYKYDIFISYRQNDNKYDGWVTEFVDNLQKELDATLKNTVSIYFDENPHDGLQETHVVDESLKKKLKCLIFIPILSQTYCDEKSFAWQHEFLAFYEMASNDELGMNTTLANGNVASRILPVRIHDIDNNDQQLFEQITGGPLRSIDFIYKEAGVNRSLKPSDDKNDNLNNTSYRNQMNKVANALKDLGRGIVSQSEGQIVQRNTEKSTIPKPKNRSSKRSVYVGLAGILLVVLGYFGYTNYFSSDDKKVTELLIGDKTIAVLPFSNTKPDRETDFLGFAIANQIIGDLDYNKNVIVRPASSIRKYDKQVVNDFIVAEELNVNYILSGNYLIQAEIIRLDIELIEVKGNNMIWRDKIEVDYSNAFELQDIVAKKVVSGLQTQFTPTELGRIGKNIPKNSLAYEYYLRAVSYPLSMEGTRFAVEMLTKSIELDSNYAPTYSHLAFRTQLLSQFDLGGPSFKVAAENYYLKALSLNSDLLSAQADLAILYVETNRIAKAINLARKMVEINPNNAVGHFALSYIYRYGGMLIEAVEESERAITLDPKNPRFRRLGLAYVDLGDLKRASELFDLDKGSAYSLSWQGDILLKQGKKDQALVYFDSIISMRDEPLWVLVATIDKAFIQNKPKLGLKALIELEENDISDGEAWYYWAAKYALINDDKGSIRCFKRAVTTGYINYPFILDDPNMASVRDNPEFQRILAQAKEKHEAFKAKFF